jgi:hypothetical protein
MRRKVESDSLNSSRQDRKTAAGVPGLRRTCHEPGKSSAAESRAVNLFRRFFRGKVDEFKDWRDPDREENPMACPEIVIEQIPLDLYAKLLNEATAAGATFYGTKASFQHLEFDWDYDQPSQTLRMTCTKKPFYATCGEVESRIRELAEKARVAL